MVVALVLVAAMLAGCGSKPKEPDYFEPVKPIYITSPILAAREGNQVVWRIQVVNAGSVAQDGLSLHMSIRYTSQENPAAVPDEAPSLEIGTLSGRQAEVYTLRTAYHGFGDYQGPVQVWQGESTLAKEFAWYEECRGYC